MRGHFRAGSSGVSVFDQAASRSDRVFQSFCLIITNTAFSRCHTILLMPSLTEPTSGSTECSQKSIAVIGGGIGGLSAGLALVRAGLDVQVYEQTHTLREVGAGIQISPNASRILHRLGLADEAATLGVKPLALRQRRWDDGRTLRCTPLGAAIESACGSPYYQSHRADLLDALKSHFPAERLHMGHRFTELVDHGDRVVAHFENGKNITVDALIGADGIHSTVRGNMFGGACPQFTGCVAYRGLIAAGRLASLELPVESQIWMGPGKHFVHYFVRGTKLVNFVAIVEQESWMRESWSEQAAVSEVRAAFEGWHPQVRAILGASEQSFVWGLFDHAPMTHWSAGRVALLGDACHAMLPFLAQGAAQAIEDGAALAACLAQVGGKEIPGALRCYESSRLPRASRIQAASRENKTRFHLPDGPQQRERDAQIRDSATDWFLKAFGWVYGHDAEAVDSATGCSGEG
jgi:salicylate hydroxylase